MAKSQSGGPLNALTGLRFWAAFAVFNLHYFSPEHWGFHVPDYILAIRDAGIAGVSLFFMLSGFVLAYAYSEIKPRKSETLEFWASRFARIYPAYALGMIWFAPFILMHRFSTETTGVAVGKSLASFVPTALLVQSWFHPRFAISWNGPGWTLSVELVFYLLFPFMAARIRSLSSQNQLLLAGACWLVSIVLSILSPLLFHDSETGIAFSSFHPVFHLPTFILGAALGYHFSKNRTREYGAILTISGFLIALTMACLCHSVPAVVLHNSYFLPPFAMLLYGLASGGWPSRFLSSKIFILLGEASYALYILQFSIVFTVTWINEHFKFYDYMVIKSANPILTGLNFYIVSLVSSILMSIIVFIYFETPLRLKIKSKLIEKIRAPNHRSVDFSQSA